MRHSSSVASSAGASRLSRAGPKVSVSPSQCARGLRRQDRPAHAGEAAHEESGIALDDEMVRLEPGDIAFVVAVADLPEAHEGVHLVDVAAHRLLHASKRRTSGSEAIFSRFGSRPQPPQQPVEQGEALGIGVAEDGFGALDEVAGDVERWQPCRDRSGRASRRSPRQACRLDRLPVAHARDPARPCRSAPAARAASRQPAKSVSLSRCDRIGREVEKRVCMVKTATTARRQGTIFSRSAGWSVRPPGDQPSATMKGRTLAIDWQSRPTSSRRSRRWRRVSRMRVDDLRAEPRHAQQHLAVGPVHVDREHARGCAAPRRASDRFPGRACRPRCRRGSRAARSRRSASASRPGRAGARASAAASSAAAMKRHPGSG